jgi:hypothetical protein
MKRFSRKGAKARRKRGKPVGQVDESELALGRYLDISLKRYWVGATAEEVLTR